jgi:anti-sigma regulatory factor (Ser/Thr protein kinase)
MTNAVSESLTPDRSKAKSQAVSYFSIYFPGDREYLSEVRRWTAAVVGDKSRADDVVQVVSELAANAIQHTASGDAGGLFILHLATFTNRWHVRVDDQGGPTVPVVMTTTNEAEAGRGLAVVAALTSDWGVLGDKYARGVWAEVLKVEP